MMKHKLMIAVCCALISCALSGCRLALENEGAGTYEDRLIGLFITTEYLDLFDHESFLNDNISSFTGGEITVDGNAPKYQGRLYADITARTLISEETGETTEIEEYIFKDINGIAYFCPTMPATNGSESYVSSVSDEAISDGHTGLNYGDDKNSTTLTGTVYASPTDKNRTYYYNPVYQSGDGGVYAVSGNGVMFDYGAYGEGVAFTHTLDSTTTITENGKTKTDSISITVSISIMFAPEKIVVLQMGADNSPISRAEYEPDELPEAFTPETGTVYFIVETHKRDNTGAPKISREIYGRDAAGIETFFARADGVCVKHWMQIKEK